MRLLDRFAGLVLGLVAGVFLCWAIGAVLLYLPGETELRRSVQRSPILSEINDVVPARAPAGGARARRPDRRLPRSAGDRRAARQGAREGSRTSCVRRRASSASPGSPAGSASRARAGSRAAASSSRTRTSSPASQARESIRAGGRAFVSTVVAFDSTNDLAVLRVPGLGAPALALAPPGAQHGGRARRLSGERPAHADAGAARRDGRGSQPRRLRPRAGDDGR